MPPKFLHVILLRHYKRLLAIAFNQIGTPSSKAYMAVTNLCIMMGKILQRQSDHNVPRTNFSNGFSSGTNLMGHKIPGCLLVLLLVLYCDNFLAVFPNPKNGAEREEFLFRNEDHRTDWKLLLESYLKMEKWMK